MTAVTSTQGPPRTEEPAGAGEPPADDACEGAPAGVAPAVFRAVMRHHAKGVAVITAAADAPVGFCATSLSSVSLDPPLVSFTSGLGTASWAAMKTARHVMAHLLAEEQEDLARAFARPGPAKFGPATRWHRDALGLPVLDHALAWLLLAPVTVVPVADHALVIAQVLTATHTSGARPLIHHAGRFTHLTDT